MTRQSVDTVFRHFPFFDHHLAGCLGSAITCTVRIYTIGLVQMEFEARLSWTGAAYVGSRRFLSFEKLDFLQAICLRRELETS